jgi:N-acetylneuraminic acid mutarotase
MSDEVRELLRRGAGRSRPAWGFDSVWRRTQRQRARTTALKALATVGIVIVVAVGVPLIRSNQSADDRRIAPVGKATWQPIPASPIEGRAGNVAVWTGEEMLVWGGGIDATNDFAGLVNGAAFNPGTQDWRRLSDGPLESAGGRTAVWTGEAMLVWGGEGGDPTYGKPDNGAAYDPRADSWTELPSSPYWSLASHSAIWTGEEMVVWGGVDMERLGAAFDPRSGAWRTIAPAPIDGSFRHAAVWTGAEMIVWGGATGGGGQPLRTGAAYDPDADSWRELPRAPLSARDFPAAVWTGDEMIVWGGWNKANETLFDGAAYDPVSDAWRDLPRAPVSAGHPDTPVAWTGQEMVVVGAMGDLAAYSPEENEWAKLPEPPMGEVMSPTILRAEGELILWGGASPPKSANSASLSREGAILHLAQ